MKKYLVLGLVAVLVFSIVLVLAAKPDFTEKTHPSGKMVAMPAHAVEVAPGVFYLGKAIDKGKIVEGYAFMLKSKKEFVKPGTFCGNGICEPGENARKCPEDCIGEEPEEPDTSSCYGFLSKGAKWKIVEDYVVNPYNNDNGLNEGFIVDNLAMDIDKWEFAVGVNILGEGSSTSDSLEADFNAPDNQNEVYFSNLGETNTIAFAVVWGIFGGPPPFRELVEWDMIFDDVDFDWSAEGEANKMDFENIATHELGHAVGLGDLYNTECSEQTMYGYSTEGETKKQTLESGDITGIQKLYS